MTSTWISPIGIDLGAKNTGVYMQHFPMEGQSEEYPSVGTVLHIEKNSITFYQANRRSKRHQKRGYKRRKMAKRLFWVILREGFGVKTDSLDKRISEFLNGLLNRRGFTFLTENMDDDQLNQLPLDFIAEQIPQFNTEEPLADQIQRISAQPDLCKTILENDFIKQSSKDLTKTLNLFDPSDRKIIKTGHTALKQSLSAVVNSFINGHKPRKEYLANIRADIQNNPDINELLQQASLNADELANIIGHISNMQLRVLRKYFNQEAFKNGDKWDSQHCYKVYKRYITAWHAKTPDEKTAQTNMLKALESEPDILNCWKHTAPIYSIPPYEDQNNRRPRKCRSLLLDANKLDNIFPGWQAICKAVENVAIYDEYSFKNVPERFLQCILDCSSAIEPYSIRKVCHLPEGHNAREQFISACSSLLSGKEAEKLLSIASTYYKETKQAGSGNWFPENEKNLLRRCDKNPPRKNKVAHLHLQGMLGSTVTNEQVEELNNFWKETKVGRATIKGICEKCAKLQKEYGVAFKREYEKAEDKQLINLRKQVSETGPVLADFFKSSHTTALSDPFVLAQIHNLLSGDVHGSSKTCRECSLDNSDRMHRVVLNDEINAALAKRLPADSGRPIDGLLGRLVERIASEITQLKIDQIKNNKHPNPDKLILPVVIEQNEFSFEADMLDIKRSERCMVAKKKQKQAEKNIESDEQHWMEKSERIRMNQYCPYNGSEIGNHGQIDHIIPRSKTRKAGQGIYNAEPNLIYSSTKGNTDKGNTEYTLWQLHEKYLQDIFNTTNREQIESQIIEQWPEIIKRNPKAISRFYALTPDEQKIVRHALFIPALKEEAIQMIGQQNKVRTNGIQRWLCKNIAARLRGCLQKMYPETVIDIRFFTIPVDRIRILRETLCLEHKNLQKTTPQPIYSHIVDAANTWQAYLQQEKDDVLNDWLGMSASVPKTESLFKQLPKTATIQRIKRKPLYRKRNPESMPLIKDGIFSEKFVPTLICPDKTVRLGFAPDNAVIIKEALAEEWFNLMKNFYTKKKQPLAESLESLLQAAAISDTIIVLEIDRDKAMEFLHRAAKQHLTETECTIAQSLNAISYLIQKVNIINALVDGPKNKFRTQDDILKSDYFIIKLKHTLGHGKKIEGNITLPVKCEWERLANHEFLKNCWGEKTGDFNWDVFYQQCGLFKTTMQNTNSHHAVRKEFSLPRLQSVASTVRINRSTPSGKIWQVQQTHSTYAGFAISDTNEVNFNNPQAIAMFKQSANLHLKDDINTIASQHICYMDDWLDLEIHEDLSGIINTVSMAPGQKGSRCYIRITLPFSQFKTLIKPLLKTGENINDAYDCLADYKLEKAAKTTFKQTFKNLLNAPRDTIRIEEIGPDITLRYQSENSTAYLRDAYLEAWKQQGENHETPDNH